MKNISLLDAKRKSALIKRQRRGAIGKIEKVFSKVARQEAFIESVAKLPVDEAVSRAKLIASVNPSDFRIVRMPG